MGSKEGQRKMGVREEREVKVCHKQTSAVYVFQFTSSSGVMMRVYSCAETGNVSLEN